MIFERISPTDVARPALVIGHRGAAGRRPENTLMSFSHAVELGVSAVELDVHTVEGELVVIHDDTLDRTTNGTGSVAACSLAQLRELDAGCGAAVPLLREVFELLGSTTGVNVELKGAGTAPRLASLLGDYPNQDLLVSSFDHEALRVFHRARADVPVAPLFHRWQRNAWQIADTIGAWSINLSARTASGARIAKAHANGFRVLVYTVNKVGVANRLRAFGVDGVFTDYPDRITLACLNDPTPG